MTDTAVNPSPSSRILENWIRLEGALRAALPSCSVQPPNQPGELLSALRVNHRIGPDQEARILKLREVRNRVAHDPTEAPESEADAFEEEVADLLGSLRGQNPPTG